MLEALGDRNLDWLSGKTGVPPATLGDYVRRGITRADNAATIAQALGVTLDWLLAGRGGSWDEADLVAIPLQDVNVAAGAGTVAVEPGHQADWLFHRDWLTRIFGRFDGLRIVRIVGDSMEPELSEGDWIMIDLNRNELRDGPHVVRLDDFLMLKRVQVEGRYVRLVSTNPAYEPIRIDLHQEPERLTVVGRMVWSGKVHVAA